MIAAYNLIFEQRFFIYAALVALPLLLIDPSAKPTRGLLARFTERTMLVFIALLFGYFACHYLWGFPWHNGWRQLGGAAGILVFALFTFFAGSRFLALYRDAVEGPGTRNLAGILQIALLVLGVVIVFHSGKNLLVGKSHIVSGSRLAIKLPLEPGGNYAVLSGGYLTTNNPDFNVPAKRYALHIAGQPAGRTLQVVAPCDGTIKQIFTEPARADSVWQLVTMPHAERYGLSIALKCLSATSILLLSNLDLATVSVTVGDTVAAGTALAKTGRSEYRQRSGLLVHAVASDGSAQPLTRQKLFVTGAGIPLRINGQLLVKGESLSPAAGW